jgi:hypothetical protein
MAKKIVDITEKLSFDENPVLKVKDVTVEVNSDAATVLKIMGIFSKDTSAKEVLAAYELIFNEKDRKKIDKLNLQFKDFQTIIMAAVDMITGDEEPGEQ